MVFALIGVFARGPVRPFRIVAGVVVALSFTQPLTIEFPVRNGLFFR